MPNNGVEIESHLYWPWDAEQLKERLATLAVPYKENRRWHFWRQFTLGPIPEQAREPLRQFHQQVVESEQAW